MSEYGKRYYLRCLIEKVSKVGYGCKNKITKKTKRGLWISVFSHLWCLVHLVRSNWTYV